MPARASVVIVGGGVIGVSAAFHLAEAGIHDVVLLERDTLGSGSTSKAAGGVRAQFSDEVNVRLGQRSLEAFANFGERPGQDIDLHTDGYLFLLSTPEQVDAFAGSVAMQNALGVHSRMLDPGDAARLSPLVSTDGLLAAAFSAGDGFCAPDSVVYGYARAARRLGARLFTGCELTGIDVDARGIRAVQTSQGRIETDTVICAAGAWSAAVGAMAGVELDVTPYRRQIVVTEPLAELPQRFPMTIDFSSTFYFHREGQGLLLGMSDADTPPGFDLRWDDAFLERLAEVATQRAPAVLDAGVAHRWTGLYEVTPDHNALVGEATVPSRFLYATGFSGHGFLMGPAIGEVLRDLVCGDTPVTDVAPLDADRFAGAGARPERNLV